MNTQTELKLEQLPYGREAAAVSDFLAAPAKLFAAIGKLLNVLEEAITMRNRYVELDALDQATLAKLGIARPDISQIVAAEAGLLVPPTTRVAGNSNLRNVRAA